jgi:hypothetical protein
LSYAGSTLLNASSEDYIEVNTNKTNYADMSRHQNKGKYEIFLISNKPLENVAWLKYLGMTV